MLERISIQFSSALYDHQINTSETLLVGLYAAIRAAVAQSI